MLKKNVETFIGCDSSYDKAKIVVFGAPYDSTTSFRPGARFGSSAIRHESFGIETYSPYQDKDLTDCFVFDNGDLELPFGDPKPALKQIRAKTAKILDSGKLPIMLGGEHLVTFGAVKAAAQKYPNLHIIHLDAHADLRNDYLGVTYSHACVIRRCHDLLGDGRIYQFGIRSGEKEEFEFAKAHTYLNKFNLGGIDKAIEAIKNNPVYLTLDLDVLDPSLFCGTGTPEAGGVSFNELIEALFLLTDKLNIIGADLCELAPMLDASGASTAISCKILRELILALS